MNDFCSEFSTGIDRVGMNRRMIDKSEMLSVSCKTKEYSAFGMSTLMVLLQPGYYLDAP